MRQRKSVGFWGQEIVSCKKHVADKICEPGQLAMDLFSGQITAAKAGLEFPRHCRLDSCEDDAECFEASMGMPVEMYARSISHKKLDSLGAGKMLYDCRIVVRALRELWARKRIRYWKVPDRPCPVHMIPPNISFKAFKLQAVGTLPYSKYDEKLFADYGTNYELNL